MRKIFTLLFILISFSMAAQNYNNEWINFSQTYYKFKVAQAGIYRIPKSVLDGAGIGNTQVQFFELWHNGQRVPFYPSVSSGILPANGYLEFWGIANDGKPDKAMYRDPNYQHTDKLSLISDTAMYYLSVNTNQSGFLVQDVVNNVAANTLPVEPYFMYTTGSYFRERLNYGFAAVVNEYVYSSSYDKGEFWASVDIYPGTPHVSALVNMKTYTGGGPNSTIKFGAVGNALDPRTVKVQLNSTSILDTTMDYFNDISTTIPINTNMLTSSITNVEFDNTSPVSTDRMCVSYFEINYPRIFDFIGQKNFEFTLPAKAAGYFLNIINFNYSGVQPILYDLANGERYAGDITTSPGNIQFALPGSTNERHLVLVSQDPSNITSIAGLTPKTFTNYATAVNQGEYVIISNPVLYTSSSGKNAVDDYKNYRQSVAGGNHKVVVVDVNELIDQFGFGIKKHPLSVRNFIRYARANFSQGLNYIFLIGRGMSYDEYDYNQSDPVVDLLNLIPTFGSPASDNLLSAADLTVPVPTTPIGRLSVVSGDEIENYLDKVKEYELAQKTAPNTLDGRQWMKNVVHVTGSSDPYLGTVLCNYMDTYKQIIQDTLYGGYVSTFCKTSTDPVEQLTSEALANLFAQGISILTYFGHSSSTTLEFNIDNPQNYNNQGKYPVFYVNGCNAGNFFTFYPQRFVVNETLSEKFVLAKERGSIAFIASTHFGIVNYLNLFLTGLYNVIGNTDYGKGLGIIQRDAMQAMINATGPYDYYSRMHAEEITLHGDPSLLLNGEAKPDYVIEAQNINVTPSFISVAENTFQLKLKMVNIGKSAPDSVWVDIKRQYPDGTTGTIYHQKIKALDYEDSLVLNVPIVATRDKGQNKIIATINGDGSIDEITMANNSASEAFFIFEDEARPIYPYNYSIVTNATQKVYASTADPFTPSKSYVMEMDTTQNFNSAAKISKTITATGGVLEYIPGINYKDSTVYYWRVALVPASGPYHWNGSSFVYLSNSSEGYNQSHYFQHASSDVQRIYIDSATRRWKYGLRINNLFLRDGVFPTAANQAADFAATVNGNTVSSSACGISEVVFNIFDSVTFKEMFNANVGSPGQYGSNVVCGIERINQFEFNILDTASRRKICNFLDAIPDNDYVAFRNVSGTDPLSNTYAATWAGDTSYMGSNNSMYHKLLFQGFNDIDSFNAPRAFIFIYQKNNHSFVPKWTFSQGINDRITLSTDCLTPDTLGYITSPAFGPAKSWQDVVWRGSSLESPSADNPTVDVIGVDTVGIETTLYTLDKNTQNFDVSSVSATQYPYMKLRMRDIDSVTLTPYQLNYWRIHYLPVPEGAMSPNLFFTTTDTLNLGEKLQFAVAFKNVSKVPFDSILSRLTVIDNGNVQHPTLLSKGKPIVSGDTIICRMQIDTKNYPGHNTIYLDVNTDNNQPEQYHFNNFLYRDFYVRTDKTNPVLDVTFDGIHILNQDIVSARPHIQIKLKDESKYLLLNDTSISTVQIKYPDGTLHNYRFDNDTLRFTPATSGTDNTATIDFTPAFTSQINAAGDNYELVVTGKDMSGNKAGPIQYRIGFTVITKPMISNLLNYPNPFSTSTAFVFTVTGSNIPSNIKIQILTVTGKIVREITKAELGPLHIGRNITEFKWDGTDQYGGKLGNGVYLYRVVTTLNGRQMDKYKAEGDNTDQYFTNGYGKMYLMR